MAILHTRIQGNIIIKINYIVEKNYFIKIFII